MFLKVCVFCRCIAELTDIYEFILIFNFIWSVFVIFGSLIAAQSLMVNQLIYMNCIPFVVHLGARLLYTIPFQNLELSSTNQSIWG